MLKGYYTSYSYWGWIEQYKEYKPFASERDYIEWVMANN